VPLALPVAVTAPARSHRRQTRPRAATLAAPQRLTASPVVVTPSPERQPLATWHTGRPLQYPSAGTKLPRGLTLWTLTSALPDDSQATTPQPGAPVALPGSITERFAWLWDFALTRTLMLGWIALWRWYYRV